MNHKVELRFFVDDANGETGLGPKQTIGGDVSFNAFWDVIGIFHDVFEHWHEFKHKYFYGKYAMNIGGEMAAMGAMMYFVEEMGLDYERRLNKNSYLYTHAQMALFTTIDSIEEAIKYGYTRYGDTLESNVPNQKPMSPDLENFITDKWEEIKQWRFKNYSKEYETSSEERIPEEYKKSITLSKIRNLHRWGYWEAKRRFPRNSQNVRTLLEFFYFWKEFTKKNPAEDTYHYFSGVNFNVTKEKGIIKWSATFVGQHGIKDYKIFSNRLPTEIYLEEMIVEPEYSY